MPPNPIIVAITPMINAAINMIIINTITASIIDNPMSINMSSNPNIFSPPSIINEYYPVRTHTNTAKYGGIFLPVPLSPLELMAGAILVVAVCSVIPLVLLLEWG